MSDDVSGKLENASGLVGKKITWAGMDPKTERFYILVDGLKGLVVDDVSQIDFLESGVDVASDIVNGQLAFAKSVLALSGLEGIKHTKSCPDEEQTGGKDGQDPRKEPTTEKRNASSAGPGPECNTPEKGADEASRNAADGGERKAEKPAEPGSGSGENP